MTAWKRWQDYATMVAGVLLFVSPFVFGETSQGVAAYGAYVLGILLVLSGILAAAMRESGGVELLPAVLGVITFVSPWVLGFAGITAGSPVTFPVRTSKRDPCRGHSTDISQRSPSLSE
jgi:hypothetical protein